MVLCLLTFVGCLGNEAEKVLAMGVRQKPDVVNYEVGMPLDVTGGKVAVVYDNEPTEIVMFDLTEAFWIWALDTFVYCVATLIVLIWNYIGRKLFIFKGETK